MSIELLTYNHKEKLTEAFERSHRKIDIVSPFLSEDTADYFSKLIKKKQIPATFITRFDHEAFVKGANSTKGLTKMLHAGVEPVSYTHLLSMRITMPPFVPRKRSKESLALRLIQTQIRAFSDAQGLIANLNACLLYTSRCV